MIPILKLIKFKEFKVISLGMMLKVFLKLIGNSNFTKSQYYLYECLRF